MATSTIKSSGFKIIDLQTNYTINQVNTWEYVGLSVTIPPKTAYALAGHCIFQRSGPTGAGFGTLEDDFSTYNIDSVSDNSENAGNVFTVGYNHDNVSRTLYLWGKWAGVASNIVQIQGWLYTP